MEKNTDYIEKGDGKEISKEQIKQDAKRAADEKIKQQAIENTKKKMVIVDTNEMAEAEARKAADAYMTEDKNKTSGLRKFWKHTFLEAYYRRRQVDRVREEIKNSGNIYTGRLGDDNKAAHKNTMQAISDRFISDYEGTIKEGEKKEVLENSDPKTVQARNDIKNLISEYAKKNIEEKAFESEKNRIFNELNDVDSRRTLNSYADNLLEIAKNARIAIEHGAKMDELDFDTSIILGNAKSSLKTEAHYNNIDKAVAWTKDTKIGKFFSPALVSSAIGIGYSVLAVAGKIGKSKVAAYGTFGASVAISSALAGMNESQRLAAERAQHGLEMAEGGEYEEGSKQREKMEKFQYQMESSKVLADRLRSQMFEKDKDGKDIPKDIKQEDLDKILASLAEIDARNSLNAKNKIDLISYTNIGSVEKESTDLAILAARAKIEIRKKIEGGLTLPKGETSFDSYLEKQTEVIERSLLEGEKGIDANDKAFSKFKTKEVIKKVLITAAIGLTVGAVAQEGIAFFKDHTQGFIEGMFHHDAGTMTQTPLEHIRSWISGDSTHMAMGHAVESNIFGHDVRLPEGVSWVDNGDGTINILKGDHIVSNHFTPTWDSSGNLDADSLSRLGEDGIVASTTCTTIESTEHVTNNAGEYINNHPGSTHHISRDGWYDNDTPKPIFDQNELKLQWGGVGNTGIDASGNHILDVSHMTGSGSFHEQFSVDAQEKMRNGGLKILFSLTQGTQNQTFELPIDVNGNVVVDPNSEIGKLFFSVENGHSVFKGRFAEVVESFGSKDGVEHVKSLATLVGPGNDAISDLVPSHIDLPITDLIPSVDVEPPLFIPYVKRNPLEKLKEAGGTYDESYLDRDSLYEDPTYTDTYDEEAQITSSYEDEINSHEESDLKYSEDHKIEKISEEDMEKYLDSMKSYLDKKVDMAMMGELDKQIGEPMSNDAKISVVLPCYKEGDGVYKTLSDWTLAQKDLNPEELEIITFVNAPKKDQKLDEKTISEIERFKKDHPEFKIRLVQHNFDFPTNRKMGAIYKMPADLALYRNMKRLENGASKEAVASHLMRSGGADAMGRNPKFLREIIDFMEKHGDTEQLRTQSAYPAEVREKFPLFNLITVFNHSLSALYTRGNSNIGLGTYRARAYAEASGFDSSREYREEIDLGSRIREKVGNRKNALNKLVKKNAIDNPRRELFALAEGDTVLHAYSNFSKPERDDALRKFNWEKELPADMKKNVSLTEKNMNREFDAYFQHYLKKTSKESGIVSQILSGELNAKSSQSSKLHPETRLFLRNPEVVALIKEIDKERESGNKISQSSEQVKKMIEYMTKGFFDRILRVAFGLVKGPDADYDYEKSSDNSVHIVFKPRAITKLNSKAKAKWKNFDGYWGEKK